jgi:hypothetical protein
MIRALLLIFDPIATWDGIIRAQRGVVSILLVYLLPFLLLTSACEGYGLVHWGKVQHDSLIHWGKAQGEGVRYVKKFSLGETVVVEAAQLLLSLAVVFAGAKLVKSVGETFRGRHTYNQAFTAVAYGLGPLFLLRLFDTFSGISPWAPWGVGIVLSISVLYQGLPRVMEPDPSHAFGLYLMSAVLLALITGMARFVTAGYLQGEYPKLLAIVSDITARLPF